MSLYIIKFKAYKDEVKFGLSTNIQLRLQDHLAEHGEIEFAYIYNGVDAKDKEVERNVLKKYVDKKDRKNINKTSRDGWTEFFSSSHIDNVETDLFSLGYSKEVLELPENSKGCKTRFTNRKAELKKAVRSLNMVDCVLLVCYQHQKDGVVPENREEFDKIMEEIGEPSDIISDFHYEFAKEVYQHCPRGVLSLEIDLDVFRAGYVKKETND